MTHYSDHEKRIRDALEAYQHMLNNGHTSGYAFAVAFGDLDPAGCIESLLADLDAMRGALELYLAHAPEPECAIWRHVQQKARAALKGASA